MYQPLVAFLLIGTRFINQFFLLLPREMNESYRFSNHKRTDRGQGAQLPPPPKGQFGILHYSGNKFHGFGQIEFLGSWAIGPFTKVSIHELNKFSMHDQAAANQTIANDMVQIFSTLAC